MSMADRFNRFGIDLRLLRDLEKQNSRNPGNDLFATRDTPADLETIARVENLQQALLLRFLTPAGELAVLGHPDYGSRLFDLIGELNSETNRNRAKLFVLEALQAEPRVNKILAVDVTQNRSDPTRMDIAVSLLVLDSDTPLNLVFPFFLERGISA
jgi:phage baseplate assembly protein W